MLTSIRGLSAATLSAGLFLSAAPALAEEAGAAGPSGEPVDASSIDVATDVAPISADLISASAALDGAPVRSDAPDLTTSVERAIEPVEEEAASQMGGESGFSISANVAFATEYRFRGVRLTDGEFAVQGGFDLSHTSGFYAGTWASNLDEQTVGYGSTELDVYGGWSGNLTEGLSADVGIIGYLYPDAGPGEFDYVEFYSSLSFGIGPASLTGGVAYAPNQDSLDFGGGQRDNLYLYSDLSIGIPDTPITINGHVGYTDGVLTFTNDSEAFDYSIGVDVAVGQITLSGAYVGVDGDVVGDPLNIFTDDSFVLTVSASF